LVEFGNEFFFAKFLDVLGGDGFAVHDANAAACRT
jgi:hypothetical protein